VVTFKEATDVSIDMSKRHSTFFKDSKQVGAASYRI
jgi:hypothetical protein